MFIYTPYNERNIIMRPFFVFRQKKPLHSGPYEHRVPKIKNLNLFLYPRDVCVIQHRNWPLRSTILNAHGTNASPDGLCTRTHTNEACSCCFCCNSFRVDRARRKAEGAKRPRPFLRHAWAVFKKLG